MHFADEIVDQASLELPAGEKPLENEMKVAKMLIETMSEPFDAEKFKDTYREEVLAMIDARVAGKEIPKAKSKPAVHDNVVNLMDVLQRSLDESKRSRGSGARNGRSAAAAADEKPKKTTKRKTSAA